MLHILRRHKMLKILLIIVAVIFIAGVLTGAALED